MSASEFQGAEFEPGDINLVRRFGRFEVDVPRTVGYFGGIALALGVGMIEWPVALFIAGIPLVKMLNRRNAGVPVRVASQVYEGMALPVGGEAPGTVRLARTQTRRRAQTGRNDRRTRRSPKLS